MADKTKEKKKDDKKKDDKKTKDDKKPKDVKEKGKDKKEKEKKPEKSKEDTAPAPPADAASPGIPEPTLMVQGPVAGQLIPVVEAYRQKLEIIVNHMNLALMPVTDTLNVSRTQGDALLHQLRTRKEDIVRETQYDCQDMLDRLELEFRKKSSGIEHRLTDISHRQDEIHKFISRVTGPCSKQTDMLQFVNSADDLKRECDLLSRRTVPVFSSSSIGATPEELMMFPREMREMKARADAYEKFKKIVVTKDAMIAQLLEENTRLRQSNDDLKSEVQQWVASAQTRLHSSSSSSSSLGTSARR
eukprot:ANDGO_05455.mRNA.1 hypothetical protein